MEFEFRKPCVRDIPEIAAFKADFQGTGMDGTGTLLRTTPQQWLGSLAQMEDRNPPNGVPTVQYGLFEKRTGRLLGLLQIRLVLKGYLVDFGGHIGYCVRPSERRKGYAKQMLKAGLDVCRGEGLERVLITCLEDNLGSARTIESCGGILEGVVYDDVNYKANMKRYWINL